MVRCRKWKMWPQALHFRLSVPDFRFRGSGKQIAVDTKSGQSTTCILYSKYTVYRGLCVRNIILKFNIEDTAPSYTVDVSFTDESATSRTTFTQNEWDPTTRQDTHYVSNLYNSWS